MVREGYKKTEIGEIPEDWIIAVLNDFSVISRLAGAEYTSVWKETRDGEIIALRGFNIGRNRIIEKDIVRISNQLSKKLKRSRLIIGDVIYPCVGSIGNAAVIETNGKYHIQQNIARITPNSKKLNSYYLAHYLMSNLATKEVEKFTATTSQPSVLVGSLRQYSFPLPPEMGEQKAIAKALSDVDELITSLEKLIAKKRDIKTGTMQQLLTGKKRLAGFGEGKGYKQTELGEIPEDWDIKPLGSLLKIRHGRSQKEVVDPNGKYPILATGGEIGRAREPLYSKPSVLIGRKGTIDIPHYMDTPFWTVDTLFYSEIANLADAKFLYYKFLFIDWYQYNEASGVPSLNAATIEKIIQAVPSEKEEQEAISQFLTDFDTEIETLQSHLHKTKSIKQGMMQELLTGRTRLI